MMKKGLVVMTALASLVAYSGCSKFNPGKFVMPSWDTQFSAPIFNRTYTLGEILFKDSTTVSNGDTTHIFADPQSQVFTILRKQPLTGVPIGPNLQIAQVSDMTASQSVTNFKIDSPDSISYAIANPVSAGTTAPAPAFSSRPATLSPATAFTNFHTATLSNGLMHITIHNGYPATINFTNGSINIVDAQGNPLAVPISSIGANQTFDSTLNITGRTLTNNPQLTFDYSSPGIVGNATYQSNNLLTMFMSFLDLRVSSANAIIPPQPAMVIDQSIVLTDNNKVDSASIKSGTLNLTVTNMFNLQLPVHMVFGSLTRQGNISDTLTADYVLPPLGTIQPQPISLAGYELRMRDANGNPGDSLKVKAIVQVPGSNGQFVDISTADSVRTLFSMSQLSLSSFTGEVHLPNPITIANDTQKIDLGDFKSKFSGAVTFEADSTKLDLTISSIGVPYLVHLTLKPSSSTSSLPPTDSVVVDRVIQPGLNTIAIGKEFADALNSFAIKNNTLPDEFFVNGYAIVNPGPPYAVGTVTDSDEVRGTNTITMPMYMGILNASYIDTTKKPVFDSSTSARMSDVDSGRVVFEINNGLPLRMSFVAQLIDTLTGQTSTLDSLIIDPPTAFNPDGTVAAPTFRRDPVTLTGAQAQKFGRSYMRFLYNFDTPRGSPPGSQPVPFTKDNTIGLRVYGNFVFKVNQNTFK